VAGYSGTPLAAKLGIKTGTALLAVGPSRQKLGVFLGRARRDMRDDAAIWVLWPKKAVAVPTDLTKDVVRELALPLGLVDVKVCAVDATWSALKLVVRRDRRRAAHTPA
jgi:hypothetical protein